MWPGIATAVAPSSASENGMCPALWEASTIIATPASRAAAAIAAIGRTTPVTFEACVAIARRGPAPRSAVAHASRSSSPGSPSVGTTSTRRAAGALEVAQRTHHRVVLERGGHDPRSVDGEAVDREVERLGRVLREDQLVGRLGAEQVGEALAREAHDARGGDRAVVPGAAHVAAGVLEEVDDRLEHAGRLRPRGGRVVEVDVLRHSTHDPMCGAIQLV